MMKKISFLNQTRQPALRTSNSLCHRLGEYKEEYYPIDEILRQHSILEEFKPDLIWEYMNLLSPQNCYITLQA